MMTTSDKMNLEGVWLRDVVFYKHFRGYKIPVPYIMGHMAFYGKPKPFNNRIGAPMVKYGVMKNIEINLN